MISITFKLSVKYLGLTFDDALSWSHQVFKVCQSMSFYLHLLNKQKLIFKMDLLKLLIESLVFSHVLYCLPVWGPSLSDVNVNRLKHLQYQANRLCVGLQKYDHSYISSFPDSKLVATEGYDTMSHNTSAIFSTLSYTNAYGSASSIWTATSICNPNYTAVCTATKV